MSGVLHGLLAAAGSRVNDFSVYFDGTGDSLTVSGSGFNISTGDFTAECWFNITGPFFYDVVFSSTAAYQTTNNLRLGTNVSENKLILANHSGTFLTASSTFVTGVWNHVAVVRSGSTLTLYQNGVSVGSTTYSTAVASDTFYIGNVTGDANDYAPNGYISNFRLVKSAVYTANFTPPTARLGAIANTVLLTCQDSTIKDNSGSNLTITANGNAAVNSLDPFDLSIEADTYSSETEFLLKCESGNVFTDASLNAFTVTKVGSPTTSSATAKWASTFSATSFSSSNYLTVADNTVLRPGTGDFCAEFWWYPTSLTGYQTPISKGYVSAGDWALQTGLSDGKLILYMSGVAVLTCSTAVTANAWNHFAVSRQGSTVRMFVHGVAAGSATSSTNLNSTSSLNIGQAGNYPATGFLQDIRYTVGQARYTAAFNPPPGRLV